MSTRIQYNDNKGFETIQTEYKQFTLHPMGSQLDPNDEKHAEYLLVSGKWLFNESVLLNLNFYIDNYLPKYASAFLSPNSETEFGEMYFGISDDGFIQGIPFQGELDKKYIQSKINSVLFSDKIKCQDDIKKYINFDIIKVQTDEFVFDDDYNNIFEEYFNQKKIYRKKLEKYLAKKKTWCKMMNYYGDKLHTLLNTPGSRSELLNYVLLKTPKNKELIRLLKSQEEFTAKTGDEINILKQDKSSVWYWLTQWKDDMSDFVKTLKPKPPSGITNCIYPINAITTMIDMIPHWLNNSNNNINLYLIKFNFQKPKMDIDISYKTHTDDYQYCFRSMLDTGPACQPYYK